MPRTRTSRTVFIGATLTLLATLPMASCGGENRGQNAADGDHADTPAGDAGAISGPGLGVGDPLPGVTLIGVDGRPVALRSLLADAPLVVTFYRGGWCPICTRELAAWGGRMEELIAVGGTMIAITPERLDLARETRAETGAEYRVLVDHDHAAAKAFKVHFTVDDETRARYEDYGLYVSEANADGSWDLPAPATFVVDADGVVRWAFADWDYRKRADPDEVINAVRALTGRP